MTGVIDEHGGALLWGGGHFWQLGNGVAGDVATPQQVPRAMHCVSNPLFCVIDKNK